MQDQMIATDGVSAARLLLDLARAINGGATGRTRTRMDAACDMAHACGIGRTPFQVRDTVMAFARCELPPPAFNTAASNQAFRDWETEHASLLANLLRTLP